MHVPAVAVCTSLRQMMLSSPHGSAVQPRNACFGSMPAVETSSTGMMTQGLKPLIHGPVSMFIARSTCPNKLQTITSPF